MWTGGVGLCKKVSSAVYRIITGVCWYFLHASRMRADISVLSLMGENSSDPTPTANTGTGLPVCLIDVHPMPEWLSITSNTVAANGLY